MNSAKQYAQGVLDDLNTEELVRLALEKGLISDQALELIEEAVFDYYLDDYFDLETRYVDQMGD